MSICETLEPKFEYTGKVESVKVAMMVVAKRLGLWFGWWGSNGSDDDQGPTRYHSFNCDELLELK